MKIQSEIIFHCNSDIKTRLCFSNLLISIICKGKDNYFPVRNKPILLNILKPSTPINTILKHCQKN
ncbi:hypothetical protein E4K46_10240 [Neisseria meningitidis]|nr:hypothetical protein [Neisseria meningitidis]